MRLPAVAVAALVGAGLVSAPSPMPRAEAQPEFCNDAYCTPGIKGGVVLGAPCTDTSYFVFATAVAGASTREGRLVFCGSPRRYEPRYFRSPPMVGIKELNAGCTGYENKVAQAPDGLYLFCTSKNGRSYWERGD